MELDFNSFDESLNQYQEIYESLLNKTLKHLTLDFDPYISVTIVNNDYIHEINRTYRHKDAPTDVISFAFLDDAPNRDEMLHSGKNTLMIDRIAVKSIYYKHSKDGMEFLYLADENISFLFRDINRHPFKALLSMIDI